MITFLLVIGCLCLGGFLGAMIGPLNTHDAFLAGYDKGYTDGFEYARLGGKKG